MLGQFGDTLLRECHTLLAFKVERLGHDSNGQDPQIFCHFGNYRRCTGTGTAAHASHDEDHACAFKGSAQGFAIFVSRLATHFRVPVRIQTLGNNATDLDRLANYGFTQCLSIGVDCKELNAFDALAQHVIYGITAAAAATDTDTDDFNHRLVG